MRRLQPLVAFFALVLAAAPLAGQEARSLAVDRAVSDSLGADDVDAYTIQLQADRFVVADLEQHTVDVVVTVKAPDGSTVTRVDFTPRGPEPFQFESKAAGPYRIEVSPFERQSGRYTLTLRRVEPVATRPAQRVDQLMAGFADPATPGALVAVVRGGEVAFSRAYGAANLTHSIPYRVDTRTNIGSTSKQFTAFAIMLLAERGELSLDDDVREHLPELPDLGQTVTIRHLLTHTSGYREFLNAYALAGRRLDHGDWIGREEIVRLVQRQPALQNDPGAEWNYNNTAFALLSMIVERKSGEDFPDWMRANVFEPLGMENTVVRTTPAVIVRNSAQGYSPARGGGWQEASDLAGAMGAGGIYTTIGDLARWMRNFRRGTVGGPGVFDAMATPFVLTDGDTTEYGFGLFVDEYRGLRRVHHGGADVAHRSAFVYYPELDAGVIVLSNNATANVGRIADQVTDVFFADRLESRDTDTEAVAAGEAFDAADFEAEDFDGLAGRYQLVVAPVVISFMMEGDTFFTQVTGQPRVPMYPTSDSTFELRVVEASVTFHRNVEGRADSVTLHQNGHHVARRIGDDVWQPDLAALREYVGRYYSDEIETFYDFALVDDALVLNHARLDEPLDITPGSQRDRFTGEFPVIELEFTRDESGAISGIEVSNGRTRGVRFHPITVP